MGRAICSGETMALQHPELDEFIDAVNRNTAHLIRVEEITVHLAAVMQEYARAVEAYTEVLRRVLVDKEGRRA